MNRHAKQLIYAVFYLIFWAALIASVYFLFLKPAPSCFDNIQNQGEEGVDCGRPCQAVCISSDIKPIELLGRVLNFSPDPSHVSFLAQISNPNLNYAAKDFKYTFSLYGNQGGTIRVFEGRSFIYAGEVKYILVPNEVVPQAAFGKVDFKVENPDWVPAEDFKGPPRITTLGSETNVSENNLIASGQVVNNDTISFPIVTIMAIFKGQLGQAAGASETKIENLAANESRSFSIIHPNILNADTSSTKLFIYAQRP